MTDRRRLMLGGVVLVALVGALLLLPVHAWLLQAVTAVRGLGAAGVVVYGVLYVLATVLMLPATVVSLGAGLLYGQWLGSTVVAIGATVGSTLAFLLGRTALRGTVEGWMAERPRFRALDAAMADQGFKIVLLMRLSPVFPFSLINYGLGLTRVTLPEYVAATFLGILPGVFLFVYVGTTLDGLGQLASGADAGAAGQVLKWVGLLATVAVTAVITRTARRALDAELARVSEVSDV